VIGSPQLDLALERQVMIAWTREYAGVKRPLLLQATTRPPLAMLHRNDKEMREKPPVNFFCHSTSSTLE